MAYISQPSSFLDVKEDYFFCKKESQYTKFKNKILNISKERINEECEGKSQRSANKKKRYFFKRICKVQGVTSIMVS